MSDTIYKKLERAFYIREDVVQISRELLGKFIVSEAGGAKTVAMITETEAYCGATDKACHAYFKRNTNRTKVMFEQGGQAYVYRCYGIHHLFNVVTNVKGSADAVLIRAVEPTEGQDTMMQRRKIAKITPALTAGPGRLTKAMAINTATHYGSDLQGPVLWIEDRGVVVSKDDIIATTRIGIDYAGEDALLPWRFYIKDSKWVSKK